MRYNLVCADGPWSFSDRLTMDETPRGASSNYSLMSNNDIKNLEIKDIVEDNSVLALWVPGSLLQAGLDVMTNWGFRHTQTWIWVKTKKSPLATVKQQIRTKATKGQITSKDVCQILDEVDLNETLAFGMGRLFRQCHELVLMGVRGKPYKTLKNKSQRSVSFHPATKHSVKPEDLQDRLEKMFPDAQNKLELFARRPRPGWVCIGNEALLCPNEDIRQSITKLKNLNDNQIISRISLLDESSSKQEIDDLQKIWTDLI